MIKQNIPPVERILLILITSLFAFYIIPTFLKCVSYVHYTPLTNVTYDLYWTQIQTEQVVLGRGGETPFAEAKQKN